jgi:PBP superfamily domain
MSTFAIASIVNERTRATGWGTDRRHHFFTTRSPAAHPVGLRSRNAGPAQTKGVDVLRKTIGLALAVLALAACGGDDDGSGDEGGGSSLSGRIQADGSSTVAPLATLAAERFGRENSDVKVTVGVSGTGGGFERFCAGETDIANASRPIKDEEKAICE